MSCRGYRFEAADNPSDATRYRAGRGVPQEVRGETDEFLEAVSDRENLLHEVGMRAAVLTSVSSRRRRRG